MKHFSYLIISLFLVIGLACNDDDNPDDLMRAREVAWNATAEEIKSTITTEWRRAIVRVEEENYLVIFNTTDEATLGPVGIYVNKSTFKIEGYAPRF